MSSVYLLLIESEMKYRTINAFRKAHRFLGLFIGVQFLFWTISGLYFSWTDIDEIHGDHYRKQPRSTPISSSIFGDSLFKNVSVPLKTLALKNIGGEAFLWINDAVLLEVKTAQVKQEITPQQAIAVVKENILASYAPVHAERITAVGPHHEYRGRPLPAYRISLSGEGNPVAYVDARNGDFQRIRHTQWRWFDFLWMTHTMDYQGRDNFNTWLLRAFSLLGLITVFSGFALGWVTWVKQSRKKS